MKDIAIFGYKDSLVGQLINLLEEKVRKKINCIISISKLPDLDPDEEHIKRPNKKTEFVINNKIFGLPVYIEKNFIKILRQRKIKRVFIVEDRGYVRSIISNTVKKAKIIILSFVHKSVSLIGQNNIGEGTIIFPDCHIGYKSDIGAGCIIQSGCRVQHHNSIGNFCDINPNMQTGGFTKIGNFTEINISVDIINKIKIGNYSRVGAGSLVLKDVGNKELHYGRPSKFIRKN
jgi:UDP-3-O-[3-hydroxymyristoyl] glucosamine N-acyltransferase